MKRFLVSLLVACCLILNVQAKELDELHSSSVVIYDLNEDRVLVDINGEEERSVASLTKMVSVITAIELLEKNNEINLDTKITVSEAMLEDLDIEASIMGLKVDDEVTYEDLLYGCLLPSGADATLVLAHGLKGNVASFVDEMNALVKRVGLDHSFFENTSGLEGEKQHSCAYDMALLLDYALKNATFKTVFTTKAYTTTNDLELKTTLDIYHEIFGIEAPRILGSKTGFTDEAGMCLASFFESNGHELISITLNANKDGEAYHIEDGNDIIAYMDEHFTDIILTHENEPLTTDIVHNSKVKSVTIPAFDDVVYYLPDNYDANLYRYSYEPYVELSPKIKEGALIGNLHFYYDEVEITTQPVYLNEKLPFSLVQWAKENPAYACMLAGTGLLIVGIGYFVIKKKNEE